jgi:glyoxylase-like metal-dependent hydrolase (beta-lactamase superfamily II)
MSQKKLNKRSQSFKTVPVGFLEVNCYVIPSDTENLVYIIDPGASPDKIANLAKSFGCDDYVILLTHAHIDHISAIPELMELLPVSQFLLHKSDLGLYKSPANELPPIMPALETHPTPSHDFTSCDFRIIHTPGHTPGCVCYHFESINALFSGDTLFNNSIGRTDLPGGDGVKIIKSIREKLFTLPDDLKVFPGHGNSTMIGIERKNNPYAGLEVI